jgi:hypothetical protein
MWREAMMELLDQLEAENPEDPALAPKVSSSRLSIATARTVHITSRFEHQVELSQQQTQRST